MAKNLSGDLQVASANRLSDGVVVWLDDAGEWTIRLDRAAIARDEPGRRDPAASAPRPRPSRVIDPFLVAVTEDDDGTHRAAVLARKDPRLGPHLRRHRRRRGALCLIPISTVTTTTTARSSPSASISSATRCAAAWPAS